jgi:hypothetical protein
MGVTILEGLPSTPVRSTRAPEGATGTCRDRRRPQGERRGWIRPFFRANRALDVSLRMIGATLRAVAATERTLHRRPVRASRSLQDASELLATATVRLGWAARNLAELTACAGGDSPTAQQVPDMVVHATARWVSTAARLAEAANDVFAMHGSVLEGLQTGALVPERPADRRPRIVLIPRPAPVRAFLRLRQPRVRDRIAPLLLRRRRTPRPAALRIPRPSVMGRAPPPLSVCSR